MHFRGCANQKVKTLLCRAAVENRPRNVIFGTPSWSAYRHNSMSKWATTLSSRNSRRNSVSPSCSWTRIKPWSRFIFYANGKGWKSEEFTQRGISVARWSRRHEGKKEKTWPSRLDHGHTGGVSMDAKKPRDSAFIRRAEFGWHVQDKLRETLQKSSRRGRKNLALSGHDSSLV